MISDESIDLLTDCAIKICKENTDAYTGVEAVAGAFCSLIDEYLNRLDDQSRADLIRNIVACSLLKIYDPETAEWNKGYH